MANHAGSGAGWVGGGNITLEVDRDAVMPAIQLLLDEARDFMDFVLARVDRLEVNLPGGDVVSTRLAIALNNKLLRDEDSYYQRCWRHAETLVELAEAFAEAARTYGHAEDEIEAMFAGARLNEIEDGIGTSDRFGSLGDGGRYGDRYVV